MHIMDILQNSISAGSTCLHLEIVEDTAQNSLEIEISDNGSGMSEELIKQAADPFFTTRKTRKVGLGLSLLKQNCERTGGYFKLESQEGKGTKVTAGFVLNHIDRPVYGDIPAIVVMTSMSNPVIDFIYCHRKDNMNYRFSSREVQLALGGISINDPLVYPYLIEMIHENLKEAGVTLSS